MANKSIAETRTLRRCAIYTRKSSNSAFDQEITSLDSQRAICSSYIASQQHKGWVELVKRYDDSGRSGASLARPAMQELMCDIEDGLVDVVLVYKLDRLTRTLMDFVRLADFFERFGTVFVSITQNFDTADAMGRLILNVLLTFAQFERELASDRLRDKIMVMKQQGRWAGGSPPFGYDVVKGRLRINQAEAKHVCLLYEAYISTHRLEGAHAKLMEVGARRKRWKARTGNWFGGGPITLSSVDHILSNPIYIGEVTHRGQRYPGLHQPIINRATWDAVQSIRAERSIFKPMQPRNLLTGYLFDCFGRPMCVSASSQRGTAYRYYISSSSKWAKRHGHPRMRADAGQLEQLVLCTIQAFLVDRERVRAALIRNGVVDSDLDILGKAGAGSAAFLDRLPVNKLRTILEAIVTRIELSRERLKIVLRIGEVRRFLAWDGVGFFRADSESWSRPQVTHVLDVHASIVRFRRRSFFPVEPRPALPLRPVPNLVSLIREARKADELLLTQRNRTIDELAAIADRTTSTFIKLLRLNYLAPDIVTAIIDGSQPKHLTRRDLLKADIPMDWTLQRRILGFPDSSDSSVSSQPYFETGNQRDPRPR